MEPVIHQSVQRVTTLILQVVRPGGPLLCQNVLPCAWRGTRSLGMALYWSSVTPTYTKPCGPTLLAFLVW